MYFKFRTRILTRTLDIPRPWRRKEVRDSQLYLKENGIPQSLRCWNDWKKPVTQYSEVSVLCVVEFWKGRGCFEHRTPIANDSFSKSAQHLRTSCLLERRVWSEVWWNFRKIYEDRKWEKNERSETAKSKFFGANSKEWNRLRECFQNFATLEKEIQFTKVYEDASFQKRVSIRSLRRWWFWRSNFEHAESIHSPSCWFRFQNLCRNPRTNCNWTSDSSSCYLIFWALMRLKFRSIHDNAKSKPLGEGDIQKEESVRGWVHLKDPRRNPTSSRSFFSSKSYPRIVFEVQHRGRWWRKVVNKFGHRPAHRTWFTDALDHHKPQFWKSCKDGCTLPVPRWFQTPGATSSNWISDLERQRHVSAREIMRLGSASGLDRMHHRFCRASRPTWNVLRKEACLDVPVDTRGVVLPIFFPSTWAFSALVAKRVVSAQYSRVGLGCQGRWRVLETFFSDWTVRLLPLGGTSDCTMSVRTLDESGLTDLDADSTPFSVNGIGRLKEARSVLPFVRQFNGSLSTHRWEDDEGCQPWERRARRRSHAGVVFTRHSHGRLLPIERSSCFFGRHLRHQQARTEELWPFTDHQGKTQLWNRSGLASSHCGSPYFRLLRSGWKVLGTPLGHTEFLKAHLREVIEFPQASWKLMSEFARKRLDSCLPQGHEDHTSRAKDIIRWRTKTWIACLFLMPQAMKVPDTKAAVDKQWKKFETIPAWQSHKEGKKEVILEAQRDKRKSTLPHGWTSVISQKMRSWNCSKVTLCKTTLEPCSIYWTGIWYVTNDDRKK